MEECPEKGPRAPSSAQGRHFFRPGIGVHYTLGPPLSGARLNPVREAFVRQARKSSYVAKPRGPSISRLQTALNWRMVSADSSLRESPVRPLRIWTHSSSLGSPYRS